MQQFYKGRTNNHLTWVMVDSTDFATPESALSAATKIKIYGKLRSGTGVNFVSSGTGSLTNDIQHVGASALGIYTIALVKADLSDASAAWYDQYIISLSATGAAYQTLVVDGGINDSYLSDVGSYLSNHVSNLSAVVSDIRSDVSDMHSDLIVMSGILSDAYSALVALSDAVSNVQSETTSQFAVVSNYLSYLSAVVSGLGAGASASAIADKVWSDFQSKVGRSVSDVMSELIALSDAVSNVQSETTSQFAVVSNYLSYLSAIVSALGAPPTASAIADKVWSDFGSKAGATPSQLYSVVLIGSSAASDAASAAAQANSRVLLVQSRLSDFDSRLVSDVSDIKSFLSDFSSDFQSRVTGAAATASQLADRIWSDFESKAGASPSQLYSVVLLSASRVSDIQSYLAGLSASLSDVDSAVSSQFTALSALVSDAHSAAILAASHASDAYSALTTARAEPGTSTPAATNSPLRKVDFLFKAWRNTQQQDATSYVLYNDDGTTAGQKATVADDGASFTRGEVATG